MKLRALSRTDLEALPQGLREWMVAVDGMVRGFERIVEGVNNLPVSTATTVPEVVADLNAALETLRS